MAGCFSTGAAEDSENINNSGEAKILFETKKLIFKKEPVTVVVLPRLNVRTHPHANALT